MSRHHTRVRTGEGRPNLYDEITDKITAELEAGRVPWVQPWGTAAAKATLAIPKNASTARQYSGVNILILWGAVIEREFTGQSWLTFRQALSLGGHVRKGERGTSVVYADRFVPAEEKRRARETGEEAQAVPFLKRFVVFNTDQCDGLPADIATTAPPPLPAMIEPSGRSPDQGDRHRLPHRRQSRLLCADGGLRAGAAAGGLFRADQLAPHRAPRTFPRQRS